MSEIEASSRLRRERDILDRIENVKRLIQMETTLLTANGAHPYCHYCQTDKDGTCIGSPWNDLLHDLRDEIYMQLLSITALCYGDNPDVGEPMPVLEWKQGSEGAHPADKFHDAWEECLSWNA